MLNSYAILSFFVSIHIFQDAFYKYFKALIRKMDEIEETKHFELTLQIVKIVRFHNSAKE